MRVLFFGSGSPASVIALQALLPSTSIAGVVVPHNEGHFWQRNPAASLIELARRQHLKVYEFESRRQHELAVQLGREGVEADVICVGTFPSILRPEILKIAPVGGINLHWSLLPRHRGPDPLFWTYVGDDRVTGVTVHWLEERPDTGNILLRREIPLARGRSVLDLYYELATIGGELVAEAIKLVREGRAPREPQDERQATQELSRTAGGWHIDAERWPAERVWHVLRGLTIGSASLLTDARGAPMIHGPARSYFVEQHDREAGTIEQLADGWRVFCVDGHVDVERVRPRLFRSLLARVVRALPRPGR